MKYIEKNDDGCWNWTGGVVGKFGHGQFRFGDRSMVASRMSWILFRGEIPSDDSAYGTKHVCHKCDNPKCVNPEHLFLGDNQVNVDDKISKGRHRYGVSLGRAHGNAKLDEAKVRYIRTSELPTSHIARELGIAQATAWAIKNRKAWKHVK
jgi:hypothetical protein